MRLDKAEEPVVWVFVVVPNTDPETETWILDLYYPAPIFSSGISDGFSSIPKRFREKFC